MTSYINDHPPFKISPAYDIPLSLKNLLSEIWAQQYQEHSKEHDGNAITSLSDAFTSVLDVLWPESISVHAGHKRYVWMAYALREARAALVQILDNCFEGYAVLQDVYRRRDFFHWWLAEVVPAAWCLRLPKVIYQAG